MRVELPTEKNRRDRFADATQQDIERASVALLCYRLTSLAVIRLNGRDARRMCCSDLIDVGSCSFPEMALRMEILENFAPRVVKHRPDPIGRSFEEVVPPVRIRS